MTTTLDNKICVRVSTDDKGRHFMDVTLPTYAQVLIHPNGVVHVNVNDSCVFRLCKAGELSVENNYTVTRKDNQ